MLNKESSNKCIIDSLTEAELEEYLTDDKEASYSHISYSATGAINGFVLAREGQKSIFNKTNHVKVVTLEKIIVDPLIRRKNLGKQLLHTLATVAVARKQDEVRLLIYKANVGAIKFYFKFGFDYVDKERDAPFDSFLIAAKVSVLLQKTA